MSALPRATQAKGLLRQPLFAPLRLAAPAALALVLCGLGAARAEPVAARLANLSVPETCAENDNVTLTFSGEQVRRFSVTALHPAYIGTLKADRTAPDWTACGRGPGGESGAPAPLVPSQVLYETGDVRIVGFTDEKFWRPRGVAFSVKGQLFSGLSMIQIFLRPPQAPADAPLYEVVVIYPPDGYWRLRPFPPAAMAEAAYGSSVLLGPVEIQGRPVVDLTSIAFDPERRVFDIAFAKSGRAQLAIAEADRERLKLDVALEGPVAGTPFAALRSMYVTEFNADVARIAWRAPGAQGWGEGPVLSFGASAALEVWTGRLVPSRHNTSAPDTQFGPFEGP